MNSATHGYSPNVQEILDNFEVRNQIPKLTKADALGTLIEKLLDPSLDLSPSGLDNHGMGSVFEELVRRFNEEASEHWTPQDAVRLTARLIFEPIADHIPSGTYRLYEPDPELRDSERIPFTEPAGEHADGIEAFLRREVLPYAPDAWMDAPKTKTGCEISFTRHFYKPTPLRTLDEIHALREETEDLLAEIVGGDAQ